MNGLDVAGSDLAFLVDGERQFLWLVVLAIEFKFHFLEIENDIGHVLNHTRSRGELVLRAGDLYRGTGRAFERRKHDASEGVPNGVTVASLIRLGGELCLRLCG